VQHERIALSRKDLNRVHSERLNANAVDLDDNLGRSAMSVRCLSAIQRDTHHRMSIDGEDEVGIA
jgi:hypothetical protein